MVRFGLCWNILASLAVNVLGFSILLLACYWYGIGFGHEPRAPSPTPSPTEQVQLAAADLRDRDPERALKLLDDGIKQYQDCPEDEQLSYLIFRADLLHANSALCRNPEHATSLRNERDKMLRLADDLVIRDFGDQREFPLVATMKKVFSDDDLRRQNPK